MHSKREGRLALPKAASRWNRKFRHRKLRLSELKRFAAWVVEAFSEAYNAHLNPSEEEEAEVKNPRSTFMGTIRKYLKISDRQKVGFAVFSQPSLNRIHLFDVAKKKVKAKTFPGTGYFDTSRKKKIKYGFAGGEFGTVLVNGEIFDKPDPLGIILGNSKPGGFTRSIWMTGLSPSGGESIVVFSDQKLIASASRFFTKFVEENSIYRGCVTTIDRKGLDISDKPIFTNWEDIVPLQKVEEASKEMEFVAGQIIADPTLKGLTYLFVGPPGTGKTTHIKAISQDFIGMNLAVFIVHGLSDQIGLKDIYRTASENAPSLVVIEDADSIAQNREDGHGGGYGQMNFNDLLSVLDGETAFSGVFTIAATNFPDQLDRAIASRPGRMGRIFRFPYPSPKDRVRLFELYKKKLSISRLSLGPEAKEFLYHRDGVTPDHIHQLCVSALRRNEVHGHSIRSCFEYLASEMAETVDADRKFLEDREGVGFKPPRSFRGGKRPAYRDPRRKRKFL